MGTCDSKPQNIKPTQPPPIDLIQPILPNDITSPQEKLEYLLSHLVQEYLKNKQQNYQQLINNLVDQMKIKNEEFGQYNDQLVQKFQGIVDNQNNNKEQIQSIIKFLQQQFREFIQLEQQFIEIDHQLYMKTFKFLIDLYHILKIKHSGDEEQQYWFGDYMIKYEEKSHQQQSDNQNGFKVESLKQIQILLQQTVGDSIQSIKYRQKQQQLLRISESQEEVMTNIQKNQYENFVHKPMQLNQKYTTVVRKFNEYIYIKSIYTIIYEKSIYNNLSKLFSLKIW